MNNDLISGQKAIETEKALEMLPSAQSEPEELDFVQPHKKIGVYLEIGQPERKKEQRISLCNEHSDYEENFCPNCGADTERWTGWII